MWGQKRSYITSKQSASVGKWTTWETVINRTVTWLTWRILQVHLGLPIRVADNNLPSPQNMHHWYGPKKNCQLSCFENPSERVTVSHNRILFSCKVLPWQGSAEADLQEGLRSTNLKRVNRAIDEKARQQSSWQWHQRWGNLCGKQGSTGKLHGAVGKYL